jgi:type II secretory pathway pseudopilin PulG
MKFGLRRLHAFSLVEVTVALGIAAFCLVAVFGLVPVGVQTNRNATSQTAATNILSSVVSDFRASPPAAGGTAKYGIARNKLSSSTVCFDGQGQFTTLSGNAPCPATFIPTGGVTTSSRYRLYVSIGSNNNAVVYPNYAYLKVTWPAAVDPLSTTITPSGSVETVAAFFNK